MAHLAHMVFFTLKDVSTESQSGMVDACRKYLSEHPGIVYFSVGLRGEEYDRPVNVLNYHVGLHVVFEDKAAHDVYQVDERHLQFIEENKANWDNVRIFDTYC